MNWHDMDIDEQNAFIESEAKKIASRMSKKINAAAKYRQKKIGALDDIVSYEIAKKVAIFLQIL